MTDETRPTTSEEAVYQALLMLLQKTPRPLAAAQFIRWLEQDGYAVVPVADLPQPVDAEDDAPNPNPIGSDRWFGFEEGDRAAGERPATGQTIARGAPDEIHFHDAGDASYADIRAGRYECVDPGCPDHALDLGRS